MDVYDKTKTQPIWDRVLAGREVSQPQTPAPEPQLLLQRACQMQVAYVALAAGPCRMQQRALQQLAQAARYRAGQLAAVQFVQSGQQPQRPRPGRPDCRSPARLLRQLYYQERDDAAQFPQLARLQPEHAALYDELARQALAHMTAVVGLLQAHMRL